MKPKLPKGYSEFFADLKEYEGLNEEEQKYITNFFLEMYNDKISFEGAHILKSPNMIKEARKNHNAVKRDAMRVAHKTGRLTTIDQVNNPKNRAFMDEMSREDEWRNAFKIGGYELAGKHILNQTIEDIKDSKDDKTLGEILLRYLLSFRQLRLEHRKDKRDKGKFK